MQYVVCIGNGVRLSSKVPCEGALWVKGKRLLSLQLCATVSSGVPYLYLFLELLLGLLTRKTKYYFLSSRGKWLNKYTIKLQIYRDFGDKF